MSSVCRSSLSCVDVRESTRASYKNLYKWPESDAEFVKSTAAGRRRGERGDPSGTNLEERRRPRAGPSVVDSFSCRQLYLRSYVFTKEETVPEKTKWYCLRKDKKTAAVLPVFPSGSTESSGGVNVDTKRKAKKHKKTKKDCAALRKLRDILHRLLCNAGVHVDTKRKAKKDCAAITKLRDILHRLLCTAGVDAVDRDGLTIFSSSS